MTLRFNQFSREYLESIPVGELLPQQPPFVMVGHLVQIDDKATTSTFEIQADNIFCEAGVFSAAGMMENIAQTCALRMGFIGKYLSGGEVQIGFIGAVRDYQVHGLARVGETLTTRVEVQEEVFGMTLAKAEVRAGQRLLAATEIKIALSSPAS